MQRTITKRSYWSPQTGQVCGDLDKAAKKYTLRNKVSIMLQSVTAAPSDVRVWFMSLLVTLGVLVFSGERSPKFFKVSKGKEGCSFSKKKPGGMLLLKSPKTTQQGGRFVAWKASSKVSKSAEVMYPLKRVGRSLVRENIGHLQ